MIVNNYIELYNLVVETELKKIPAIQFFINAVDNSVTCNCADKKEYAQFKYKNLLADLTVIEYHQVLNYFKTDKIKLL